MKRNQLYVWLAVTGGLVWFLFLRKKPARPAAEKPGSTLYTPQQGSVAAQGGARLAAAEGNGLNLNGILGSLGGLIGGLFGKGGGSGGGSGGGLGLQIGSKGGGGSGGGGKGGGGGSTSQREEPVDRAAINGTNFDGPPMDLFDPGFDYGFDPRDPGGELMQGGTFGGGEEPWTGETSTQDLGTLDPGGELDPVFAADDPFDGYFGDEGYGYDDSGDGGAYEGYFD